MQNEIAVYILVSVFKTIRYTLVYSHLTHEIVSLYQIHFMKLFYIYAIGRIHTKQIVCSVLKRNYREYSHPFFCRYA